MKYLILILLLVCAGCATPSKIIREYTIIDGKSYLIKETIEYDNSTFYSIRVYGLDVGIDPTTKIPTIRFGVIKYESARISKGQIYDSEFGFSDISLIKGEGEGYQCFRIEDTKDAD